MSVRCESPGLNPGRAFETARLEYGEESGIPGVEVKFVDIRRNTDGEGSFLDRY